MDGRRKRTSGGESPSHRGVTPARGDAVSLDIAILYALTTEVFLGPKMVATLLARFGQPTAIWDADVDLVAQTVGLSEGGRERLVRARALTESIAEGVSAMTAGGTSLISIVDERYPSRLFRLTDPPTILFVRGQLPAPESIAVAVVGTHQADAEGVADAVAWGKGLAGRGAVVISGLARGVDGAAHTGSLAGEGETVAVLPSGFDHLYPPEHAGLAEEITRHGALISEYPPGITVSKARLVYRNRIIAALADAVVVVRIRPDRRGSMEVIRRARDLACPVFMVTDAANEAALQAVADGAIPIDPVPDVDLVLRYL